MTSTEGKGGNHAGCSRNVINLRAGFSNDGILVGNSYSRDRCHRCYLSTYYYKLVVVATSTDSLLLVLLFESNLDISCSQ